MSMTYFALAALQTTPEDPSKPPPPARTMTDLLSELGATALNEVNWGRRVNWRPLKSQDRQATNRHETIESLRDKFLVQLNSIIDVLKHDGKCTIFMTPKDILEHQQRRCPQLVAPLPVDSHNINKVDMLFGKSFTNDGIEYVEAARARAQATDIDEPSSPRTPRYLEEIADKPSLIVCTDEPKAPVFSGSLEDGIRQSTAL